MLVHFTVPIAYSLYLYGMSLSDLPLTHCSIVPAPVEFGACSRWFIDVWRDLLTLLRTQVVSYWSLHSLALNLLDLPFVWPASSSI